MLTHLKGQTYVLAGPVNIGLYFHDNGTATVIDTGWMITAGGDCSRRYGKKTQLLAILSIPTAMPIIVAVMLRPKENRGCNVGLAVGGSHHREPLLRAVLFIRR